LTAGGILAVKEIRQGVRADNGHLNPGNCLVVRPNNGDAVHVELVNQVG
jgi:hypothetical protein